jgi:quinol monooxygenase YgiN
VENQPSGPTRVLVNLHVGLDKEQPFLHAWLAHAEACRGETGVRQFELFRSVAFPENFLLAELWDDRESFERHFAADHGRSSRSSLLELGYRRHGEDGIEIYAPQRLFAVVDGIAVPTQKRGWGPE